MFCPNCGNQNPDNVNYCTDCGATLNNNAAAYQNFDENTYKAETINTEGIYATDASKFRKFARERLGGRWGDAAILMVLFLLCSFGINLVASVIPIIGGIAVSIISPVLSFGLLAQWIKIKNGEIINYFDFFTVGFNNFGKVWSVLLNVILKLLGPIILISVSSIFMAVAPILYFFGKGGAIASVIIFLIMIPLIIVGIIWFIPLYYKYMFALNELIYNSSQNAKDIVERSGNFMIGKRVGAFWLNLTFIGWCLLATLGCGIPFLWVTPYMSIASVIYYEWASNRLNG